MRKALAAVVRGEKGNRKQNKCIQGYFSLVMAENGKSEHEVEALSSCLCNRNPLLIDVHHFTKQSN